MIMVHFSNFCTIEKEEEKSHHIFLYIPKFIYVVRWVSFYPLLT